MSNHHHRHHQLVVVLETIDTMKLSFVAFLVLATAVLLSTQAAADKIKTERHLQEGTEEPTEAPTDADVPTLEPTPQGTDGDTIAPTKEEERDRFFNLRPARTSKPTAAPTVLTFAPTTMTTTDAPTTDAPTTSL